MSPVIGSHGRSTVAPVADPFLKLEHGSPPGLRASATRCPLQSKPRRLTGRDIIITTTTTIIIVILIIIPTLAAAAAAQVPRERRAPRPPPPRAL
eukprot:scaffold2480_cov385-Prasinococcus_capsulatus_cf.AAC.9